MHEWLYGRNAVYEALRADRRKFIRLRVSEGVQEKGRIQSILQFCQEKQVPLEKVPRDNLIAIGSGSQGVALEVSEYPYSHLDEILVVARSRGEAPFLLLLDLIQDPQNLGALIRTAEITGVHGVLLPLRQTATLTPAVVNASAGASEHLLIAQANLAQAVREIKKQGVWVVGLENSAGALPPGKMRLDGPIAFIVGNEGAGMRRLVRESCDLLLRLPMRGRIESHNAAVAGSIALYLAWQARGFHGADVG